MKIGNQDPLLRLKNMANRLEESERSQASAQTTKERPRVGDTSVPHDEVQISAQVVEMQRLRSAVDASPDLRESIVQQLKDEIASGRYRIDGTRIADELLKE